MTSRTLLILRPVRRGTRLFFSVPLLIAGASLLASDTATMVWLSGNAASSVTIAIPPPSEVAVLLTNTPLAITPTDALALNAARPLDRMPANPAKPFFLPVASGTGGGGAALDCLTQAIYFEAGSESDTGKRAVAQVVLNRVHSPIFPHTVCGVVFQGSQQRTGCQFTFTCDGSLARQPSLGGWIAARRIALAALSGRVERAVGLATHYHANYVIPYWASSLDKVATIGAHIFYTMRGSLGRPAGFGMRYDDAAEAPPSAPPGIDAAVDPLVALTGEQPGTNAVAAPPPNPNRTVVRDDSLGIPDRPAPGLEAPKSVLRADETRGELTADKNKGVLGGEH